MSTVRDICVEALSRSNLCPRKRTPSAELFRDAFNLFTGILQEYSDNGFIVAYQNDLDFQPNKTRYVVGKDSEQTDLVVDSLEKPYRVYYRPKGVIDWVPLFFISYNQFFTCGNGDFVVSWKPLDDNLWEIIFKDRFIPLHNECKLVYNIEMNFKDDDVVSLPSQYIELLTRALAYKLSVAKPRVDGNKTDMLKMELDILEKQIIADNSNERIITRSSIYGNSLLGDFFGGTFISNQWY